MDAWAVTGFQIDDEIELRQFTPDDVDIVFDAVHRNAEHLMEYMHWMRPDYSREMSAEFIRSSIESRDKRESLGFGIFRDGLVIGAVGFASFDWESKVTEIGYWIDRTEEGKGIVSRACKRLIDYAFADLGMNRIQIRCAAGNVRSAAIPERFGFKKEGCLRQSQFRNGKLHDFLVFGLLRSEWQSKNYA
jgi:ribosomal-protein-serine acetyltransferase